jgi:hypothetical protein
MGRGPRKPNECHTRSVQGRHNLLTISSYKSQRSQATATTYRPLETYCSALPVREAAHPGRAGVGGVSVGWSCTSVDTVGPWRYPPLVPRPQTCSNDLLRYLLRARETATYLARLVPESDRSLSAIPYGQRRFSHCSMLNAPSLPAPMIGRRAWPSNLPSSANQHAVQLSSSSI